MLVATWNVNSVRARLGRVLGYLQAQSVDVLLMQETKVADAAFPTEPFTQAGYQVAHWGVNQWNGVAIASRVGLEQVERGFPGQPLWAGKAGQPVLEPRALGATCGGARWWSLYVPHGRALGDPHMAYKLEFLGALRQAAAGWLASDAGARVGLLGDFNVAPQDSDVWDISAFAGSTHVSPPERAALASLSEAGYIEVSRQYVPDEGCYTFWDYQQLRFPRNQGMRIDFAYCSPALAAQVQAVQLHRSERKGQTPSDHIPLQLTLP
jgi:exodeoxyribonuclease-3